MIATKTRTPAYRATHARGRGVYERSARKDFQKIRSTTIPVDYALRWRWRGSLFRQVSGNQTKPTLLRQATSYFRSERVGIFSMALKVCMYQTEIRLVAVIFEGQASFSMVWAWRQLQIYQHI